MRRPVRTPTSDALTLSGIPDALGPVPALSALTDDLAGSDPTWVWWPGSLKRIDVQAGEVTPITEYKFFVIGKWGQLRSEAG